MKIRITDRETCREAILESDSPPFSWTEGNYSCDCNRALFFADARNEDHIGGRTIEGFDGLEFPPCGDTRFWADYWDGERWESMDWKRKRIEEREQ